MANRKSELLFKIHKISELSCYFETPPLTSNVNEDTIRLEIFLDIKTDIQNELIWIKFGVSYFSTDSIDLENPFTIYKTLFVFKIHEFNSIIIKKDEKKFLNSEILEKMLEMTVSGTRGMLFVKFNGTMPQNYILPFFSLDSIVRAFSKEEIDSQPIIEDWLLQ